VLDLIGTRYHRRIPRALTYDSRATSWACEDAEDEAQPWSRIEKIGGRADLLLRPRDMLVPQKPSDCSLSFGWWRVRGCRYGWICLVVAESRAIHHPAESFLVGPSHSFEQLAEAIDVAFARWDLSHLHCFELADGRRIGYPDDSFGLDLEWLNHAKLKVAKEVKPGEEFEYVFDLGDYWQHRCPVRPEKTDPLEEYGETPGHPVVISGWGSIPDQYGRRSFDDDEEDDD
jgi:Plasmid pRiA4b ORF-3-like protein